MIPNFKDLTERAVLEGDKIKLDELLNKQIIVTGIHLTKSKYADRGSGKCSKIQFYFPDSDKKRSWSLKRGMLLSQKGYVTVAKGVCYCRKRGMLLSHKIF